MFGRQKKFTTIKMIEMEEQVSERVLSFLDMDNIEAEVSNRLKLKVEYVESLPNNHEAELCPIDEVGYLGLIKLRKDLKKYRFAFMHEIMHYIFDVGVGNRVECVFGRSRKGKTESEAEQEINYKTAACIMPYGKILDDILLYDQSHPKMDEIKFIADLKEKYQQSDVGIIRRIHEVRRLKKAGYNPA